MRKIVLFFTLILTTSLLVSCDKKVYNITININDDSETVLTDIVKHGEKILEPSGEYTKETFVFSNWLNRETGKEFSFDESITSNLIIDGVWKSDGIRRGTFNREYPSYYQKNVPLVDDAHVMYINFDGFARYYYDEALKRNPDSLPNFRSIMDEGVFFEDLRTTTPSITNPTQNMIISGATTKETKNVYRYYDRKTKTVIQQQRQNETDTIFDKVIEADMSVASILFYLAEQKLTYNDPNRLYVQHDNTNPKVVARGSEKYGDFYSRLEQAIKLVKGEKIKTGGGEVTVSKLPKFTALYMDDLDALGHNERDVYGNKMSLSEKDRLDKIVDYLNDIDEKLGEFFTEAKKSGVYDKITFFMTTDHGMTSFGTSSGSEGGKYISSKLADLGYALSQFDKKFELEKVEPEGKPKARTSVVGVGMNLNLQLTFLEDISDEKLEELKEHLLKEEYVGVVKTRAELEEEGYWTYAADMIVSPSERYHFAPNINTQYRVRGQHDSYLDSSNHIYGMVWGNGIKKGVIYKDRAFNYDFGITMAAALGLDLPRANGIVLDIFEKEE